MHKWEVSPRALFVVRSPLARHGYLATFESVRKLVGRLHPYTFFFCLARVRTRGDEGRRYSSPQNPQRPRSRLWGSGVTVVSVILVVRANNYRTEPTRNVGVAQAGKKAHKGQLHGLPWNVGQAKALSRSVGDEFPIAEGSHSYESHLRFPPNAE